MKLISRIGCQVVKTLAVAALCMAGHAMAAPSTTWNFSQSFGTDGTLSGSFTGNDIDGDGRIILNSGNASANELFSISLNFAGTFTSSWTMGYAQLADPGANNEFNWIINSDFNVVDSGGNGSPVSISTEPDSHGLFAFWYAGTPNFDLTDQYKGQLTIYDYNGDPAVDAQAPSAVTVMAAPVPEPSTYAMMALGLAALGAVGRRRQRQATAV